MESVVRVTHVIPSLGRGGAEQFLLHLTRALRPLGVECDLFVLQNTIHFDDDLDVPVYTAAMPSVTIYQPRPWLSASRELRSHLAARVPNIVHSHLFAADVITGLVVSDDLPWFATLHSADPWWTSRRLRSRAKSRLVEWLFKRRSATLIAVSRAVSTAAHDSLRLRSDPVVIVNGIPPRMPVVAEATRRTAAGPVIIQVGRMDQSKNHVTSIRAFATLLATYPDAKLIFAGDGPLRRSLEAECERLRIQKSVEFKGRVSKVDELLTTADIFWMPSIVEGLPLACLEAMRAGLPVVVSRAGGLEELVANGENGVVVDGSSPEELAAATDHILGDRSYATRLAAQARSTIALRFDIETTARQYAELYRDFLQIRGTGPR